MSWSRRGVLAASASALGLLAAAGPGPARRRRLVVVLADGGWDVSYVFDPKPGLVTVEGPEVDRDPDDPDDVEALATFSGLTVQINDARRPAVTAFFERWAAHSAVVNGIFVGSIGHHLARVRMLTGIGSSHPGPDLAQIVGSSHAVGGAVGCVDLSGFSSPGHLAPTSIGVGARSQLASLLDLAAPIPRPDQLPAERRWIPDAADLDALSAYHRDRIAALPQDRGVRDLSAAMDRAEVLSARSDTLTSILLPGQAPTLAGQIDLAVALLAEDLCHTVFLDTAEDWDTHGDTVSQHGRFDRTFAQLDRLASGLDSASLLDETLVVVISEMTRAPVRNVQGGKDHWAHTSALLIGGGTAGGQVLGHTDPWLQALPVDLQTGLPDPSGVRLDHASFLAGLMERLDVDPEPWIPGVRPWRGARS